jgi:EAL domain-containing protein (putative c-di-GMP-specific phosphodiesterase class I)/GGDEF domain-containing protein
MPPGTNSLPLRIILLVPLAMQVVATMGAVGYVSWRNERQTLEDLAKQFIEENQQQVKQHLQTFFSEPLALVRMNAEAIEVEHWDSQDSEAMHRYFDRQMQAFPQLKYVGYDRPITHEMGKIGLKHRIKGSITSTPPLSIKPVKPPGDRSAFRQGKAGWGPITLAQPSPSPEAAAASAPCLTIRATIPLYSPQDRPAGVVLADVSLAFLSQFLQTGPTEQNGSQHRAQHRSRHRSRHSTLFIMERSGQLVGSSGTEPLFRQQGGTIERYRLETTPDRLIRQIGQHLQAFQRIQQTQLSKVTIEGKSHYVQVTPWQDGHGLDWLVVMAVPESDFLPHHQVNWLLIVGLGGGALGGAIALGLWTANQITAPLRNSIEAAETLALGQWECQMPKSQVKEFTQLGQAFEKMAAQLQASFARLEHQAFHDTLTGLLNQDAFRRDLTQFLGQCYKANPSQLFPYQSSQLQIPQSIQSQTVQSSQSQIVQSQIIQSQIIQSQIVQSPSSPLFPLPRSSCQSPADQSVIPLGVSAQETPTSSQRFAVLFLDLDDFKVVNDSFGHLMGDQLLIAVADRLRQVLKPQERLARFGGDAFMLLSTWLKQDETDFQDASFPPEKGQGGLYMEQQEADQRALEERAQSLVDLFQEPFYVQGQEIFMSASVGVMPWNQGGENPEDFFQGADIALYQAKLKGKGGYQMFTPMMQAAAIERLRLETELRLALERNELRVYYQPILNTQTRQLEGFEALVRWQHPVHGLIPPGVFIPTAEESGLIVALGWWVMRAACWQMKQWQERFGEARSLFMSVNVSSKQLLQSNCADMMETIVRETALSLDDLKLEITESGVIELSGPVRDCLNYLQERHFQFSIDDFGTGYAGFSYLQHLPVNTLKIDRSFIKEIDQSPKNWHIVSTIVSLVHQIGLTVVAEGVETESQLQKLQEIGCDLVQGYLFSAPVPGSVIEEIFFTHATV